MRLWSKGQGRGALKESNVRVTWERRGRGRLLATKVAPLGLLLFTPHCFFPEYHLEDDGLGGAGGSDSVGGNPGVGGNPSAGGANADDGNGGANGDTGGSTSDGGSGGGSGDGGSGGNGSGCTQGTTRCNSDGLLESCNADGRYVNPVECPWVCIDDACGGECEPTTEGCEDEVTPRVCGDDGEWDLGEECDGVCTGGVCEESCEEGTFQCIDGDQFVCTSGNWGLDAPCPYVCNDETGQCDGECAPTTTDCLDPNTLLVCLSTGLYDEITCTDSACQGEPAGCSGTCSPGTTQCSDENELETCSDSGSFDADECDGQTCVEASGSASCVGTCEPSETWCESGHPQACDDGNAMQTDTCTAMEVCRDAACVAKTQYSVGHTTQVGSTSQISASTLVLIPVTVPYRARVMSFRQLAPVNASGRFVSFVLYEDEGGVPVSRVAVSVEAQMPTTAGTVSANPAVVTVIDAGNYWVGAVYSADTNIYEATSGTLRYVSDDYDQSFPASLMDTEPATLTHNLSLLLEDSN